MSDSDTRQPPEGEGPIGVTLRGIRRFTARQVESVCRDIDPGLDSTEIVEECATWIRHRVREAFGIESRGASNKELHGLKKQIDQKARRAALGSPDGVLMRAGVRHVIFRTATILSIMARLGDGELDPAGAEVGLSAAKDLVEKLLVKKLRVPANPEAFVALWDYWDRSGGWGRLELRQSTETDANKQSWRLAIKDSFLRSDSGGDASGRRFEAFCGGYIKGFLNGALPKVCGLIFSMEPFEAQEVTLPAHLRVQKVSLVETYEREGGREDVFLVEFEREFYTAARDHLNRSQTLLESAPTDAATFAKLAARSAYDEFKVQLPKKSVAPISHELVLQLVGVDPRSQAVLLAQLNDLAAPPRSEDAREWFAVANTFVRTLSRFATGWESFAAKMGSIGQELTYRQLVTLMVLITNGQTVRPAKPFTRRIREYTTAFVEVDLGVPGMHSHCKFQRIELEPAGDEGGGEVCQLLATTVNDGGANAPALRIYGAGADGRPKSLDSTVDDRGNPVTAIGSDIREIFILASYGEEAFLDMIGICVQASYFGEHGDVPVQFLLGVRRDWHPSTKAVEFAKFATASVRADLQPGTMGLREVTTQGRRTLGARTLAEHLRRFEPIRGVDPDAMKGLYPEAFARLAEDPEALERSLWIAGEDIGTVRHDVHVFSRLKK